jgi:hypothetical protein
MIALGPPPKRPLSGPSVLQDSTDTLSWPIVLRRSFCDDLLFPSVPVLCWDRVSLASGVGP